MLFWMIAAVLTAIVTLALLGPVARARTARSGAPEAHDIEVYHDQLEEVERDLADDLMEAGQAEVARTEISRRLLAASRKHHAAINDDERAQNRGLRRGAAALMAVFMPLMAVSAYLELGRPDLPHSPLSARLQADPGTTDIAKLVAQAERHLAENPEDGRGWAVLGPIYQRTGRFEEAAAAFQKSISVLGPSSQRLASLGEALFSAAGGVVTEEAALAFQTARELDPNDPRPQFFLAVGLTQSGKRAEALAAFEALIQSAPADAPWVSAVRKQIAALGNAPGAVTGPLSGAGSVAPGNPTADDIAAAQDMSPEERRMMISSMIEGLEARLTDNPDDIEGWLRLVRSLAVTGERSRAQAALGRAFALFAGRGSQNQALVDLARELGLATTSTLGGVPVASTDPLDTEQPVAPSANAESPFILQGASPGTLGATSAPGGPTPADVAAAAAMSADDRSAMISGMVASLDARLRDNPDDIEGWLRLLRSYSVLGQRDAALSALERANTTFPGDSPGGLALYQLAVQLGLTTTVESQ